MELCCSETARLIRQFRIRRSMAPSPQEVLPWKITFAVKFNEKSLGMVFQENKEPEVTQGGVFYTTIQRIRKEVSVVVPAFTLVFQNEFKSLEKGKRTQGSAQRYNSRLKAGQEHL